MPDQPYVDPSTALLPVGPGGTRVRMFRRRNREEPDQERTPEQEVANDAAWNELLEDAVEELNAAFARDGVPFTCVLEEDARGLSLGIRRAGAPPSSGEEQGAAEEEVHLSPADLPRWLARLRLRLGLLVDETA